jgi:signal transduction histidine kinase
MIEAVTARAERGQLTASRVLPTLRFQGLAASLGLSSLTLAYVLAVGLLGTVAFLVAASQLDSAYLPGVALFVALSVAADRISIRMSAEGFVLTPSTMVNAASMFLVPVPGAVVVAFLGSWGGDLLDRRAWYRGLFNAGQIACAYVAASLIWQTGVDHTVPNAAELYRLLPLALVAMVAVYVLNTGLLSLVLALVTNGNVWHVWKTNHYRGALQWLGMHVMGVLFAGAWLVDVRAVLLLCVPAWLTWMSSRHLRALEEKARVEQELRQKSEALAVRWEALAQIGESLGGTVDPKALIEVATKVVTDHCADAACIVAPGAGVATSARPDAPPQLRARLAASVATIDGYVATGVMALPLSVSDMDVGTLYAAWSEGAPTAEQAALLDRVVERIAMALQNVKLSSEAAEVHALREIDRMKSDLLASVSHELTSPIALVMGYAELLEKRPPEKEQAVWMGGKILAAGHHLKRMVEDLLDAGRLESGRLSLDRQVVDLGEIAETAIESARAAHSGPRFELVPAGEAIRVEGDRARLVQVLTNLLQNAARYGPPDGVVRLIANADGDRACVAVEDQGPGVPPGERTRIFEKFYRTYGAQSKAKKGLGLGLTIANDLVLAHGGAIKVEDAPTGGARFVVELPRVEAQT